MTLVEFISARLDETEQQAREDEWVHLAPGWTAYILADVDAKRRIIEMHADVEFTADWLKEPRTFHSCAMCGTADEYPVDWPCKTLLALTLPYADHPDFDPAWR
jgi:hypothetical protein